MCKLFTVHLTYDIEQSGLPGGCPPIHLYGPDPVMLFSPHHAPPPGP